MTEPRHTRFPSSSAWNLWTKEDEKRLRAEIERRFRERTPPKDAYAADPANRVLRGEIRGWVKDTIGKPMPELDEEWAKAIASWYKRMSKRVIRELDPPAREEW